MARIKGKSFSRLLTPHTLNIESHNENSDFILYNSFLLNKNSIPWYFLCEIIICHNFFKISVIDLLAQKKMIWRRCMLRILIRTHTNCFSRLIQSSEFVHLSKSFFSQRSIWKRVAMYFAYVLFPQIIIWVSKTPVVLLIFTFFPFFDWSIKLSTSLYLCEMM